MVYHVQFPGLGLDLTVNRVALTIGGFKIYWYGVIIAAGMLLAMLYAFRNAVDYGIDSDRLVDVVASGTVGHCRQRYFGDGACAGRDDGRHHDGGQLAQCAPLAA